MRLSKAPKVKYSPMEQRMFSLLSNDFTSSDELIKKLFGADAPFYARDSVNSLLASLTKKLRINDEPVELERTKRNGPNPTSARLRRRP